MCGIVRRWIHVFLWWLQNYTVGMLYWTYLLHIYVSPCNFGKLSPSKLPLPSHSLTCSFTIVMTMLEDEEWGFYTIDADIGTKYRNMSTHCHWQPEGPHIKLTVAYVDVILSLKPLLNLFAWSFLVFPILVYSKYKCFRLAFPYVHVH